MKRWFFAPIVLGWTILCPPTATAQTLPPVATETPAQTATTGQAESADQTDTANEADASATAETATGADASPDQPLYLRIKESPSGKPLAMQTAIVRYRGKPGTPYAGKIVDLVGVVHIGQREYYRELNERLSRYDKVLYELVAPDGTRIRPEDLEERRSLLASMQSGMKDMLNLAYQLEQIDYLAGNFRHADMSPTEFMEDFEERGDSVWKMVARMMGAGLASQSRTGGDTGVLLALFSDNRSMRMKQAMARQLVDMELVTAGMDDASGDNTLIKGRNEKAFEILNEELEAGHDELAVFYGAGHLPDMAERLEQDFQMRPEATTWLDAWDLTRN